MDNKQIKETKSQVSLHSKDIEGNYKVKVSAGKSEPIEDLMLFGRTKYENAHLMAIGKLSVEEFMNAWYQRYTDDLK